LPQRTHLSAIHALLALLAVLVWGSNFVVIKLALAHFPPFYFAALRFFFRRVLKRRLPADSIPYPKYTHHRTPCVLSPDEVARLIEAAGNLQARAILMALYSTGMRRSELVHLRIEDIDSERMVIHIQQGKGSRDRDVPMTPKLLEVLGEYFRRKRPKVYLFPGTEGHRGVEKPISDETVWYACRQAARRAGIRVAINLAVAGTAGTMLED